MSLSIRVCAGRGQGACAAKGAPVGTAAPFSRTVVGVDHDRGVVPACVQLLVAGDDRDPQALRQRQIGGVIAGVLVAQGPHPVGQERRLVPCDGEVRVEAAGLLSVVKGQGPAQDHAAQGGEDLDVQQVRRRQVPRHGVQERRIGLAADQRLDHRGSVDDDHLRPTLTAATT